MNKRKPIRSWAHHYLLRMGARGSLVDWLIADDGVELEADDAEQLLTD